MTRIRYNQISDGIFLSPPIFCKEFFAVVCINTQSRTLAILNNTDKAILFQIPGINYIQAQKMAKIILKQYGAEFFDEVRRK